MAVARSLSLLPVLLCPIPGAAAFDFHDVTAASGLDFRHTSGASPEKYMPETMGAGVCLLDADLDGRLDVYLVDGGSIGPDGVRPGPPDRLFRNVTGAEGIRFEDATERSGLGDRGFGMGCTAGDVENDGDPDLYVSNYGANTLWLNDGKGRFVEAGASAGVRGGAWSASAAFGDLDGDGRLDLWVTGYVDFKPGENKYCGDLRRGLRAYCHPDVYDGVAPTLYRNLGRGRFADVTRAAGAFTTAGKGLGVVLTDYDGDGLLDVYQANDSTINFLFRNRGGGKLEDVSLLSGAGFDANGRAQAGMGVDAGDADGDGVIDLFVTNLDLETNTLYRGAGGRFRDVTVETGLALPSLLRVGFGTAFVDADQDGDLDIVVINGHILDNVEKFKDNVTYAQAAQLYENDGRGRFRDASKEAGEFFARPIVGRGLAPGDLDGDGDLDLVVTTCGQAAYVLENRTAGGRSLLVKLVGRESNRDGYGARLTLKLGERTLLRECRSATSYLSQGDARVHFGLGGAERAQELVVRWPGGKVEKLGALAAGHEHVVEEGRGVVATKAFARLAGAEAAGLARPAAPASPASR